MTTVAILPISDINGERLYRAVTGNKHSVGKTAGQALDALTAQLDEMALETPLVIQSFRPDSLFSDIEQERLSELMDLWRSARDQGEELSSEQQTELERLVEAELKAATARTAALMQEQNA
jgi:predicted Zn-dependent protease with MMP-like domain